MVKQLKQFNLALGNPTNALCHESEKSLEKFRKKLQRSPVKGKNFRLDQRNSVRPTDISQALLDLAAADAFFWSWTDSGALCLENQLGTDSSYFI